MTFWVSLTIRGVTQGSAKGRVFPGRVDPTRVSLFRAGFRVENLKIRVSSRVPGRAPGSGTRRKPGYKFCFLTFKFKNLMIFGGTF